DHDHSPAPLSPAARGDGRGSTAAVPAGRRAFCRGVRGYAGRRAFCRGVRGYAGRRALYRGVRGYGDRSVRLRAVVTGALVAGLLAGYGVAVPVGAIAALIISLTSRTSLRVGAA